MEARKKPTHKVANIQAAKTMWLTAHKVARCTCILRGTRQARSNQDCAVFGMASRSFRVPADSETNKGSVTFINNERRAEKNKAREPSLVASASRAFCSSGEFAGGEVRL